jgi:hypothetical protein
VLLRAVAWWRLFGRPLSSIRRSSRNRVLFDAIAMSSTPTNVDEKNSRHKNVDWQNLWTRVFTHENVFARLVSNCCLKLGCESNRHQSWLVLDSWHKTKGHIVHLCIPSLGIRAWKVGRQKNRMWCCETPGFSWVFTKWICVEWVSLNECILNVGHDFYTWQIGTRHRESNAKTYTRVNCLDVKF